MTINSTGVFPTRVGVNRGLAEQGRKRVSLPHAGVNLCYSPAAPAVCVSPTRKCGGEPLGHSGDGGLSASSLRRGVNRTGALGVSQWLRGSSPHAWG